jgi:beta-lactamase regulating signal transducer with metallopeptidase domain/DUF4097 and DUF4098 domain-containing protein YvlB
VLSSLFEAALRSLMLAVLVWAGLRVFRVRNVIYQRLAWTVVLAGALLMPFLLPFTAHWARLSFATIPAVAPIHDLQAAFSPAVSSDSPIKDQSNIPGPVVPVTAQVVPPHRYHGTPKSGATIAHLDSDPIAPPRAASLHAVDVASPTRATRPHLSLFGFIALAYFLVATALLARLLLGFLSAMRLWRSATPVALGSNALFHAGLNLRSSQKVSSPVTIGSGILLPAGYKSWNEEKLRIVLAHERSHVSQHDFLLLILASLYTAVTWFSPLGWWLKHKLSDLGEAISDRSGLNAASTRSAYAQILLEFAATPRPTLIGVAMARPSNISRRIERLLNDSYLRLAFSGNGRARVAVLLVPVVLFAGAALVSVQAATQPAQTATRSNQIAPAPPSAGASLAPLAPPSADAFSAPLAPPSADAFSAPLAPPSANAVPAAPAPPSAATFAAPSAPPSADAFPPAAPIEAAMMAPPAPPVPRARVSDEGSQAEATFDRNLNFDGKLELSVATGSGHITLTRGSANQIRIHGVVKTNKDGDASKVQEIAANPPIEQTGNKITIGGQNDERLRNINIDYDIEAPADATISAATGSGNITDTGVGQNARLQTGSGSITATGLEGGYKAQTGSGNISVDGNGQGDATVQTGSGDIDVKGVHGALKAQTGSGEIKIAGTPSSAWKLQTGSGSVDLATGNAPMNLDATTGSGKISTEAPAQQTSSEEDHHHYRAQINGGGPEVSVVTGSGSIHVR